MITQRIEVGPFASNCYVVGSESTKEAMIVDAGADPGKIMKAVEAYQLKVKLIVLTHGHIDHVGAVKAVKEKTGAEVAIHTEDAESLRARNPMAMFFGPGLQTPPAPDRLLQAGDVLKIGDLSFEVLHTPGHTAGGICLLGHGVVYTGDTLFQFGVGRTDMSGGSWDELLNSIHTKLMVLPDKTIVYPGHGPETTIGNERKWNPFLRG